MHAGKVVCMQSSLVKVYIVPHQRLAGDTGVKKVAQTPLISHPLGLELRNLEGLLI